MKITIWSTDHETYKEACRYVIWALNRMGLDKQMKDNNFICEHRKLKHGEKANHELVTIESTLPVNDDELDFLKKISDATEEYKVCKMIDYSFLVPTSMLDDEKGLHFMARVLKTLSNRMLTSRFHFDIDHAPGT